MEHIEAQIDSNQGKGGGLQLYEKVEDIPVADHLYMNYDGEFNRWLQQEGNYHFQRGSLFN